MRGTIGIAIPAYGRSRHLKDTLQSVLSQKRSPEQVVVVDDASPDDTESVVRPFVDRGVAYVRNEENLGVPRNYNRALALLNTDYVMLLGDHDVLEPTYLQKCAGLLDERPATNFCSTGVTQIDEVTGAPLSVIVQPQVLRMQPRGKLARHIVSHTWSPVTLVSLIRKSALGGIHPWFDPKYFWYADLPLWIQLSLMGDFGYVAEPLLRIRMREHSHFLQGKAWYSPLQCDSINREFWGRAFGGEDEHEFQRLLYTARREVELLRMLVWSRSKGVLETPPEVKRRLSPPARLLWEVGERLPSSLLDGINQLRKRLIVRKNRRGA